MLPAPDVGVVIPTHNRPELLRRALASVRAQDYPGRIETVVVFDRSEPELELAVDDPRRPVRLITNARTPGLAGARNTGIDALDTELIAFLDDDDQWLDGKLNAQVRVLAEQPQTIFVTTAMRVDRGERSVVRLAGTDRVGLEPLLRSRMSMLHSSSFLFRREAMLGPDGFGLVDETIPMSMGEDWDLLLRAARRADIVHIDEPLIAVQWGASSYFVDAWSAKNAAHQWLLEQHPEFTGSPAALAAMEGKLAFGHAALGHRREALRHSRAALRARWREPRVPFALLVVAGVPARTVTDQLNKRGHGI